MARPRKYDWDEIADMGRLGMNVEQICDKIGAPQKTIRHILKAKGVRPGPAIRVDKKPSENSLKLRISITDEERESRLSQIEYLRKEGLTISEIASKMNTSTSSVGHMITVLREQNRLLEAKEAIDGYSFEERRLIVKYLREKLRMTFQEIGDLWQVTMPMARNIYYNQEGE